MVYARRISSVALALALTQLGCGSEGGGVNTDGATAVASDGGQDRASSGLDTASAPDAAAAELGAPADVPAADQATTPPGDGPSPPSPDAPAASAVGCPVLPLTAGPAVTVTPAMNLAALVSGAAAGTTFVLADGTYLLGGQSLRMRAPGLTVRSASNDASKVIIDGEYKTAEIVVITANDATVAHVTITRAVDHPVHVNPDGSDVIGGRLYGLRIIDGGEQFVKVNPDAARAHFVDGGRVECSFFALTAEGRSHVETLGGTSCYTGGIDVHGGRGWVVRANRFEDIHCTNGKLAEHAIHFWSGSRDTLVEGNVMRNCARGIGLGLVQDGVARLYPDNPYAGVGYIGHYDGVVRNNIVFADVPAFDTGIELAQARGAKVFHNTVFAGSGATGAFSSIDYRFANTRVELRNNLVQRITMRDGAMATLSNNKEMTPASYFKDAAAGDLHLGAVAPDAVDKGMALPEAGVDVDGEPHTAGGGPDLGADEAR